MYCWTDTAAAKCVAQVDVDHNFNGDPSLFHPYPQPWLLHHHSLSPTLQGCDDEAGGKDTLYLQQIHFEIQLSILAWNSSWVGNWPFISKRLTETVMKGWTIKTWQVRQLRDFESRASSHISRSHNLTWSLAGKVCRRVVVCTPTDIAMNALVQNI